MKRDFSLYEFVGVLIPSTILLFSLNEIVNRVFAIAIFDFSGVGDATIFLVVSYGFGHVIHALGNILERVIWWFFGGMPTKWLPKGNRFGQSLLHKSDEERIAPKLYGQFGEADKDYGRLVYNVLFHSGKTARIDIFNANYSLFRGLTVSFLILSAVCSHFLGVWFFLVAFGLALLSLMRMVRFARLYAVELFLTYLNSSG